MLDTVKYSQLSDPRRHNAPYGLLSRGQKTIII
jgi:hypothetical protein